MKFLDFDMTPSARQGLLVAGLNLMGHRGTLAEGIGRSGLLGMQAYGAAEDQAGALKRQAEEDAWRKTQRDRQESDWQRQQQMEDARRRSAASAWTGGPQPWSGAPISNTGGGSFDGDRYTQELFKAGDIQGALAARQAFARDQSKPVELNDGAALVDPVTGRTIAERQKTFGPTQSPAPSELGKLVEEMRSAPPGLRQIYMARIKQLTEQKEQQVGISYQQDANGNIVGLPDKIAPGQQVQPIQTGVAGAKTAPVNARVQDARDALGIVTQARDLLKNGGPTGSIVGNLVDKAAGAVGVSTDGAKTAAKLKAVQGSLVSKMPKMSGPQSDKDAQLYREMAGQIGDATLPAETRLAALDEIEKIQRRYAQEGSQGGGRTVVRTGRDASGRRVVQYSDGTVGYEK